MILPALAPQQLQLVRPAVDSATMALEQKTPHAPLGDNRGVEPNRPDNVLAPTPGADETQVTATPSIEAATGSAPTTAAPPPTIPTAPSSTTGPVVPTSLVAVPAQDPGRGQPRKARRTRERQKAAPPDPDQLQFDFDVPDAAAVSSPALPASPTQNVTTPASAAVTEMPQSAFGQVAAAATPAAMSTGEMGTRVPAPVEEVTISRTHPIKKELKMDEPHHESTDPALSETQRALLAPILEFAKTRERCNPIALKPILGCHYGDAGAVLEELVRQGALILKENGMDYGPATNVKICKMYSTGTASPPAAPAESALEEVGEMKTATPSTVTAATETPTPTVTATVPAPVVATPGLVAEVVAEVTKAPPDDSDTAATATTSMLPPLAPLPTPTVHAAVTPATAREVSKARPKKQRHLPKMAAAPATPAVPSATATDGLPHPVDNNPPEVAGNPLTAEAGDKPRAPDGTRSKEPSLEGDVCTLNIDQIVLDGTFPIREKLDPAAVERYARPLEEGHELPPIHVFWDGNKHILSDGRHRIEAAKSLKHHVIVCKVYVGTERDAFLHGLEQNNKNGIPMSPQDKHRAATTMLQDETWKKYSNNEIAKHCELHASSVGRLRKKLERNHSSKAGVDIRTVVTADGKTKQMNVRNIGRKAKKVSPATPAGDAPYTNEATPITVKAETPICLATAGESPTCSTATTPVVEPHHASATAPGSTPQPVADTEAQATAPIGSAVLAASPQMPIVTPTPTSSSALEGLLALVLQLSHPQALDYCVRAVTDFIVVTNLRAALRQLADLLPEVNGQEQLDGPHYQAGSGTRVGGEPSTPAQPPGINSPSSGHAGGSAYACFRDHPGYFEEDTTMAFVGGMGAVVG